MPEEAGHRLAQTLGDLAVEMQGQRDTTDTLRAIVDAAAKIVPGAQWAGISLIEGNRVVPEVPTDPVVAKLDDLQTELGDGPSLSALKEQTTVHITDMSTDTRWPQFATAALQLGVRSLLSFQLFVRRNNLGALNLYGAETGGFTEDSLDIGLILAQHAAVAMAGAAAEHQFQAGLASRDIIGQAKGLLMQRNNLTGVQAFAMLTRASQDVNMKLADVARWLVEEHERGVGAD
ncbi:GAF and ANTAR domain-containing protein [Mycobacterium barrassiae]|uniref:GAF and ANTAR domain-containing protein n=1 Tax=Mycobacterium barrassiae TaxID=319709 RepID=UPI002265965B|nr:GAF and ANTAR domain-containing protein [Mycobacterium barrassiae]MCV7303462.1 GAF and ANTAR domain-containing protein [Mycobacterium barrassiae]